jgi:hypothetical protein
MVGPVSASAMMPSQVGEWVISQVSQKIAVRWVQIPICEEKLP